MMPETIFTCPKCGQSYEQGGYCCGVPREAEMVKSVPPTTIPAKYDDGQGNPPKQGNSSK